MNHSQSQLRFQYGDYTLDREPCSFIFIPNIRTGLATGPCEIGVLQMLSPPLIRRVQVLVPLIGNSLTVRAVVFTSP